MAAKAHNRLHRFYRFLVETRWFVTFSASCTATIIGISLTLGLNTCRENRRQVKESKIVLERTVNNLCEHLEDVEQAIELFTYTDSVMISICGVPRAQITDSMAVEFMHAITTIYSNIEDRSVEHIFFNSGLNPHLAKNVILLEEIGQCFDRLDFIEEGLQLIPVEMEKILREVNKDKALLATDLKATVFAVLDYPPFYYSLLYCDDQLDFLKSHVTELGEEIECIKSEIEKEYGIVIKTDDK